VFKVSLVVDARRFRLGDEKESAGVADAVIQVGIMEIEIFGYRRNSDKLVGSPLELFWQADTRKEIDTPQEGGNTKMLLSTVEAPQDLQQQPALLFYPPDCRRKSANGM
jgi:hypothetical protein